MGFFFFLFFVWVQRLLVLLRGAMCRNHIAETDADHDTPLMSTWTRSRPAIGCPQNFPFCKRPLLVFCYIYYSKTLPAIHASLPTPLTVHVSCPSFQQKITLLLLLSTHSFHRTDRLQLRILKSLQSCVIRQQWM